MPSAHRHPPQRFPLALRLQLTPEAVRQALALREQYLRRLEELYVERQALNLQAVKVLLPEDVGARPPLAPSTS